VPRSYPQKKKLKRRKNRKAVRISPEQESPASCQFNLAYKLKKKTKGILNGTEKGVKSKIKKRPLLER